MAEHDDYGPLTDKEWAANEAAMDEYEERAADEYYAQEAAEYEKIRPGLERDLAAIKARPALLPAPWVRAVEVRDLWPSDGYEATAGPFRIEIRPSFYEDEDGGGMEWRWEVRDSRLDPGFGVFGQDGYTGDDGDIRDAAHEAIECCRRDFDPAPEADEALTALAAGLDKEGGE